MKKFLLPAMVAALALVPFQKSEAVQFGEFNVGYKFRLKVSQVLSTKTVGFGGTAVKAPIPTGVPRYAKGDPVLFEIAPKGALKISKFSSTIPFTSDAGTSNVYNKVITGTSPKTNTAIIYKSSTNKATSAALTFIRISGTAFNLTTRTVTYTLVKP